MEQSANPIARLRTITRTIQGIITKDTSLQAYIWLLTAAAPSDSVFSALSTDDWLTYLLTHQPSPVLSGCGSQSAYSRPTSWLFWRTRLHGWWRHAGMSRRHISAWPHTPLTAKRTRHVRKKACSVVHTRRYNSPTSAFPVTCVVLRLQQNNLIKTVHLFTDRSPFKDADTRNVLRHTAMQRQQTAVARKRENFPRVDVTKQLTFTYLNNIMLLQYYITTNKQYGKNLPSNYGQSHWQYTAVYNVLLKADNN